MTRSPVASWRGALSAACLLLSPGIVLAQGAFYKTPVGPGISINPMNNQITAQVDEVIEWHVDLINPISDDEFFVDYWDTPQDDECAGGLSRAYGSTTLTGGASENAPQTAISYLDLDGDGDCSETVLDASGGLVICDAARQILIIQNARIPGRTAGGASQIRFLTYLDRGVGAGFQMCNWGQIYDDRETADESDDVLHQPTTHPGRRTAGCTCMIASPPNSIDVDVEKTVMAEAVPLVPNDPASTMIYTITVRNTGGTDISGNTLTDIIPPGQEWVDVVSCPPPLTCSIAGPTFTVRGWDIPAADPDLEQTVQVRARVTCELATDDNSGVACNQGDFTVATQTLQTDDPAVGGIQDPTCIPVVFSNLTASEKRVSGYDDVDGDGLLSAGDTVNFLIRARNTGGITARNVIIRDAGLDPTCFDLDSIVARDGGTVAAGVITWNVGDIPGPFGVVEVGFSVTLTTGEVCCNQAEVNSQERVDCGMGFIVTNDPTTASVDDDPACALPGPRPDLRQEKSFAMETDRDGNGVISTDDIISYTIRIENVGLGTATGARITDALAACNSRFLGMLPDNLPPSRVYPNEIATTDGLDWGTDNSRPYGGLFDPGELIIDDLGGANGIVPGEIITIKFYVRIQRPEYCCNQSEITYTELPVPDLSDDPRTPGQPDDPTCFTEPPSGPAALFDKSLEIFDVDGDGYVGVGDRGRYTLVYSSIGTSALANVVVTDAGDACYRLLPGTITVTGPAVDSSTATDVIATATAPLAPAESITVTFDVEWLAQGRCCNQATATSVEIPTLASNDPTNGIPDDATCATIERAPTPNISLELVKTVIESGCQDFGAVLHYSLKITNTGDTRVSTWQLQDTLPPELTAVVVTPPLTLVGSLVSVADIPIDAGGFLQFTYEGQVPCTGAGGSIVNDAELTYLDALGAPVALRGSTNTRWGGPVLTTSRKSAVTNDADADGVLEPGETVDFTITVTNTGTCDARNVVVTDALAAAFDAAAATIGQGGTQAAGTVTWDSTTTPALVAIPTGASVDLTVTVPVAATAPEDTRVTNSAVIAATGNATAACGEPGAAPAAREICVNCITIPPTTQDLLVNSAVTSLASALTEVRTAVFTTVTPNTSTCGESDLDPVRDLDTLDVGGSLTTGGFVVTGHGAWQDRPLTFYEITERCQSDEGGTDDPICVRKSAGNLVIRASAMPATCP